MSEGGSYIVDGKGKPKRTAHTQPHPDGPRARDDKGRPLDQAAAEPAPAGGLKPGVDDKQKEKGK